jgi:hypothetical protein
MASGGWLLWRITDGGRSSGSIFLRSGRGIGGAADSGLVEVIGSEVLAGYRSAPRDHFLDRAIKVPIVVFEIVLGIMLGPSLLVWIQPAEFTDTLGEFRRVMLSSLPATRLTSP